MLAPIPGIGRRSPPTAKGIAFERALFGPLPDPDRRFSFAPQVAAADGMPIIGQRNGTRVRPRCDFEPVSNDGGDGMECYTIRYVDNDDATICPKCGDLTVARSGLGLFSEDDDEPICRRCGTECAPAMTALLDLAFTAERVGKSCRHLLTPPMASLLDLAHAAENYTHKKPRRQASLKRR